MQRQREERSGSCMGRVCHRRGRGRGGGGGQTPGPPPPRGAPAPPPRPRLTARPTPRPRATHPPLRDFDQAPPPFSPAGETAPQAAPSANRLTILLLGVDQRPDEVGAGGDPGRTDSILLVSLDYEAHTASMVSIPRDGFV